MGFCGGGGTPLYSANEVEYDISWLSPQSEYRPVEYLQKWLLLWQDDSRRLDAAKAIQTFRIEHIRRHWLEKPVHEKAAFNPNSGELTDSLSTFDEAVNQAKDTQQLMLAEARLTKSLYRIACQASGYQDFTRVKKGEGMDPANHFLDNGNYLAYGLGATATWVLGLPHGFSVLHGKTRRGGLVFRCCRLDKRCLGIAPSVRQPPWPGLKAKSSEPAV